MTEPMREQITGMMQVDAVLDDWAIPHPANAPRAGGVPMTTKPTILDVMSGLLGRPAHTGSAELRVSEHVWCFLRKTYATVIRPDAVTAMLASPIVVDPALTGGQWQILEDGEVTKAGDMAPAPDGMAVLYSPEAGWLAIRADLMAEAAGIVEWRSR